jgi:hypothetical protein
MNYLIMQLLDLMHCTHSKRIVFALIQEGKLPINKLHFSAIQNVIGI